MWFWGYLSGTVTGLLIAITWNLFQSLLWYLSLIHTFKILKVKCMQPSTHLGFIRRFLWQTPHTPPFAAFQKSRFWEVLASSGSLGTLRQGPWGPGEVETEFFSKFSTGLIRRFLWHPTCHLLLRFKKVGFPRSRGPFVGVPGDPVSSKQIFLSKFSTGSIRRFQWYPTCHLLLRFKKVGFRRSRGPFVGVKIFDELDQTLPMTPLLLKLNGINKNLEIPISPQISGNFRKFSEIPGNFESPVAVD